MIKLTRKEIYRHIVIWIVVIGSIVFLDQPPEDDPNPTPYIGLSVIYFGYIIIFYAEFLFILPKYYKSNKLLFLLFIGITLIIYQAIIYSVHYYIFAIEKTDSYYVGKPIYALAIRLCFLFFFVSITAFGAYQTYMNKKDIVTEKDRRKAIMVKEISFFRSQFGSSTVFNFLNYCYSKLHLESPESAKSIELFSSMLRHTIDENINEPVSLFKEIEYISNFISLHKKLNNRIRVNFEVDGDPANRKIIPRILITFVENAFKHGDIYSKNSPITFKIIVREDCVRFCLENTKKVDTRTIQSVGIGMSFVKQQLESFYKNQYDLEINQTEENYLCNLLIKI